ncbi:MAG: response regulator [Desulfobacterales bacterium]|nr:response regulator [Desulfobacterales bacterium]
MEVPKPKTILFVDDEDSILEIASEYFQLKGYHVITASHGLDALRHLKNTQIDCCFTDINMPEMDGLELAEQIRLIDNTIPVIVMTGFPSLDNTIKTLQNGVVDFLIKPVNLEQMEICVQRVMRERHLFVENIILKKEIESKKRLEKLNNELLAKVDELHAMNKIMSDFTEIQSSFDAFQLLVNLSIDITGATESRFYIVNESLKEPIKIAVAQRSEEPQESDEIFHKWINESNQDDLPLLISNTDQVDGLPSSMTSMMVIPVKIREKVFGTLITCMNNHDKHFSEKDLFFLSFMGKKSAYAIENLALYENIYSNLFQTLFAFVKMLEAKDIYTSEHSTRVAAYSVKIGEAYGCTLEELDILQFGGCLHDIGKIGISETILLKPSRLTDEEFEIIKKHPIIGSEIVGYLGLWNREQEIIRYHHERYDGRGYPEGIRGTQIPLLARILSVADSYDAMASDRAYRKKIESEQIIEIIKTNSGTQFDPEIVKIFLHLYEQGHIQ